MSLLNRIFRPDIENLKRHHATKRLVSLLGRDDEIGRSATAALIQLGDESIAALDAAIEDEPNSVGQLAVDTIGKIGGEQAIQILYKVSKKPSTALRTEAIKVLGESSNSQVISFLVDLLDGLRTPITRTETRTETVIIPGGWGDYYDTHPTREEAYEIEVIDDPDGETRKAIQLALEKLESRH